MSSEPASSTDNTLQRLRLQASTSRLYALIDPSQDERWQLSCDELELATRQFRIIANPFIDLPPWRRLYLKPLEVRDVDIPELVAQQRSSLPSKRTEPSGFCALVTSSVLSISLSRWIERQLTATSPEGKTCLLRFFDPRVMELLAFLLEPGQKTLLLHPFTGWFYFDHQQVLREMEIPREPPPAPFTLSPEQWASLKRSGTINHLIDKWRSLEPDSAAEASPERINALMRTAERHGLHTPADQQRFVLHGLHVGDDFHRHPVMQRLLESIGPSQRYGDLTAALPVAEWNEISTSTRNTAHGQSRPAQAD